MIAHDETKCGVCGRCVAFCPREALSVITRWGHWYINEDECTDCFGGAYHFEKDLPLTDKNTILDRTKTNWIRHCVVNCPVGAISLVEEQSS